MNSSIKETLAAALPWLTTAIGGPLGGVASAAISGVLGLKEGDDPVVAINNASPSQITELRKAEDEFKLKAIELGYKNVETLGQQDVDVLKEVNVTMRSEVASDHWPSYTWRPFIGFSFGLYMNSLWLLPLFHVAPVIMSPDMVLAAGGILGVASYFRGKAQVDCSNPINKG